MRGQSKSNSIQSFGFDGYMTSLWPKKLASIGCSYFTRQRSKILLDSRVASDMNFSTASHIKFKKLINFDSKLLLINRNNQSYDLREGYWFSKVIFNYINFKAFTSSIGSSFYKEARMFNPYNVILQRDQDTFTTFLKNHWKLNSKANILFLYKYIYFNNNLFQQGNYDSHVGGIEFNLIGGRNRTAFVVGFLMETQNFINIAKRGDNYSIYARVAYR